MGTDHHFLLCDLFLAVNVEWLYIDSLAKRKKLSYIKNKTVINSQKIGPSRPIDTRTSKPHQSTSLSNGIYVRDNVLSLPSAVDFVGSFIALEIDRHFDHSAKVVAGHGAARS